jgi:hypothetical protein
LVNGEKVGQSDGDQVAIVVQNDNSKRLVAPGNVNAGGKPVMSDIPLILEDTPTGFRILILATECHGTESVLLKDKRETGLFCGDVAAGLAIA